LTLFLIWVARETERQKTAWVLRADRDRERPVLYVFGNGALQRQSHIHMYIKAGATMRILLVGAFDAISPAQMHYIICIDAK